MSCTLCRVSRIHGKQEQDEIGKWEQEQPAENTDEGYKMSYID